jgi:UMF1 family MFS transporter
LTAAELLPQVAATALLWFLFTPDRPVAVHSRREALAGGLRQLRESLRSIRRYRHLLQFLVARMFFIDGLATLFVFGGIYAAGTFGMGEAEVLYFGIGLNLTGALGAATFAVLDDRIGDKHTILVFFGIGFVLLLSVPNDKPPGRTAMAKGSNKTV